MQSSPSLTEMLIFFILATILRSSDSCIFPTETSTFQQRQDVLNQILRRLLTSAITALSRGCPMQYAAEEKSSNTIIHVLILICPFVFYPALLLVTPDIHRLQTEVSLQEMCLRNTAAVS